MESSDSIAKKIRHKPLKKGHRVVHQKKQSQKKERNKGVRHGGKRLVAWTPPRKKEGFD